MDVCHAFGHDLICRLTQSSASMDQNVCSTADGKCAALILAKNCVLKMMKTACFLYFNFQNMLPCLYLSLFRLYLLLPSQRKICFSAKKAQIDLKVNEKVKIMCVSELIRRTGLTSKVQHVLPTSCLTGLLTF